MKPRIRRRLIGFGALAAVGAVFLLCVAVLDTQLRNTAFFTGWTLLVTMIFLALYNLRKQFPVPPLISSRVWLQLHIYAGLFTFIAFWAHAGSFAPPTGVLEGAIWLLYLGVAISGLIGLFITRTFPQRLTSRGEEVIFERIPEVIRDLRARVEQIAETSVVHSGAPTIALFYTERLRHFFLRPRHLFRHVIGYHSALARRMNELDDQYRYLNEDERKMFAEIARCVRAKDAIDHQYALQLILKVWLFVHVPLTYAVLVFSIVHVLLVYAFHASLR